MCMRPSKYYYALVWDTALKNGETLIEGTLVNRNTKLPKDPRMMYGTSPKDVQKVRIEKYKQVTEYDILTTKQTVRFVKELEEYELSRDIRIVIWEGSEFLNVFTDYYRVVSQDFFEELVKIAPEKTGLEMIEQAFDNEEFKWKATVSPEQFLKAKILNTLNLNLEFV